MSPLSISSSRRVCVSMAVIITRHIIPLRRTEPQTDITDLHFDSVIMEDGEDQSESSSTTATPTESLVTLQPQVVTPSYPIAHSFFLDTWPALRSLSAVFCNTLELLLLSQPGMRSVTQVRDQLVAVITLQYLGHLGFNIPDLQLS